MKKNKDLDFHFETGDADLSESEIEAKIQNRHNRLMNRMGKIKMVAFDVDGVLTDGKLYFGAMGEEIKVFNAKDGAAFFNFRERGLKIGIFSGRDCPALRARFNSLPVDYFFVGLKNKTATFENLLKKIKMKPDQVLYVGDDEPDLGIIGQVGISLAPSDATEIVKRLVDAVLNLKGGKGLASMVADMFAMYDIYQKRESKSKKTTGTLGGEDVLN